MVKLDEHDMSRCAFFITDRDCSIGIGAKTYVGVGEGNCAELVMQAFTGVVLRSPKMHKMNILNLERFFWFLGRQNCATS